MSERRIIRGELMMDGVVGEAFGRYVLGAQLLTRDGRKIGNGCIVELVGDLATVITDFGNECRLNSREIEELFYLPVWIVETEGYICRRDTLRGDL